MAQAATALSPHWLDKHVKTNLLGHFLRYRAATTNRNQQSFPSLAFGYEADPAGVFIR
jgi:hypothetical protein